MRKTRKKTMARVLIDSNLLSFLEHSFSLVLFPLGLLGSMLVTVL